MDTLPGLATPDPADGGVMADLGEPTPLERLIREGRVRQAARRKRTVPDPVPAGGTVSDLVSEQRDRRWDGLSEGPDSVRP